MQNTKKALSMLILMLGKFMYFKKTLAVDFYNQIIKYAKTILFFWQQAPKRQLSRQAKPDLPNPLKLGSFIKEKTRCLCQQG